MLFIPTSLDRTWPSFDDSTGWSIHGKYSSMPKDTWDTLSRFYAPHNARLQDFIGIDFGWNSS